MPFCWPITTRYLAHFTYTSAYVTLDLYIWHACLLASSGLQPFDLVEITMATVNSQAFLSSECHFEPFGVQDAVRK